MLDNFQMTEISEVNDNEKPKKINNSNANNTKGTI